MKVKAYIYGSQDRKLFSNPNFNGKLKTGNPGPLKKHAKKFDRINIKKGGRNT